MIVIRLIRVICRCVCLDWETVNVTGDPAVPILSKAIIQAINEETASVRSLCAPLRILKLESVKRLVPNTAVLRYRNAKDKDGFVPDLSGDTQVAFALYQLKLYTTPGKALYEATVKYDSRMAKVTLDLEGISHINRYGDKPHCIIDQDYFKAKWCVCYDKVEPGETW